MHVKGGQPDPEAGPPDQKVLDSVRKAKSLLRSMDEKIGGYTLEKVHCLADSLGVRSDYLPVGGSGQFVSPLKGLLQKRSELGETIMGGAIKKRLGFGPPSLGKRKLSQASSL